MAGLLAGVFSLPTARAADEQPLEYQVRAAFVFNFTKFIEWSPATLPDAGSPISICILGDDPFGTALDQIVQGEVVNSRRLLIQRLRRPPAAKTCQVLYINRAEKDVARILSGLGPGVLTVGEGPAFLREGGMVAFIVENHHVRFDINQRAADTAMVKISSRLLKVARSVEK